MPVLENEVLEKNLEKKQECIEKRDLENSKYYNRSLKTECENCRDLISFRAMSIHLKCCKVYSEFLKKSLDGYVCTLCSYVHKYRKNMYQHLRKDHGNVNVLEKILEKKDEFKGKNTGIDEILKNNEIPELKNEVSEEANEPASTYCQFCGKVFTEKSILLLHIRTVHEKEKSFPCSKCDSIFAQESQLMKHIMTVHDEKNL